MSANAEPPTVTVVVPVGRVDVRLETQLRALQRQRYAEPWELLLVLNRPGEDGALDELLASVALPATVVDASGTRSASHARNAGARAARADLLAFCDADDEVAENWLEEIVSGLSAHEVVGGHLDEDRLAVPGQEHWRPPATPGELPMFLGDPYVVTANMGIRRELFNEVGGFDESLVRGEDIALSWLLLRRGLALGYSPKAVVYYRHRAGMRAMVSQHFHYGRGMSQVLVRYPRPGGGSRGGLLRPNKQPVARRSWMHYLRRGSLAAGRAAGLIEETVRRLRRRTRRPRGAQSA